MNCQDTQTLIHGYMDGELDLVRSMEFERHLQECPACEQLHKNQQSLRSAVRNGAPYFRSPAGLEKRIHSALREAHKSEARTRAVRWRFRWRPSWAIAVSLAVVAMGAWVVTSIVPRRSAEDLLVQEVLSSHVRSLMANHLTDVASSDQHTVKPWFNGKLDFSPPVKDLSNEGFPLVGGRLDYVEGRPVAALVYQRRKHLINLLIWPSAHKAEAANKVLARQGYNLLHWAQSDMTYWAVSDLNRVELEEFVRRVSSESAPKAQP